MKTSELSRSVRYVIPFMLAAAIPVVAGEQTAMRLERAAAVLNSMTDPIHGIKPDYLAKTDCVVVIPGFKLGAALVGVGYGRGYMSCRKGDGWSAPAAMVLEGGSVGVQFGGQSIDVVILSMNKENRSKFWDERFAVGSDAAAAWGNGKSAHQDANGEFIFYGKTKGVFGGIGLDGAVLKRDASGNQGLFGKEMTTYEIIHESTDTPANASRFIAALPE